MMECCVCYLAAPGPQFSLKKRQDDKTVAKMAYNLLVALPQIPRRGFDRLQLEKEFKIMPTTKTHCTLLILLTVSLYLACARDQSSGIMNPPPPGPTMQPTLSSIQATTFAPTCGIAPCHVAGGLAPFRLDATAQSFASLVGVQSLHNPNKNRVTAGNPANSYVLDIIQGMGVNGAVMPPGGNNLLSPAQVQQISDWITAGALNN